METFFAIDFLATSLVGAPPSEPDRDATTQRAASLTRIARIELADFKPSTKGTITGFFVPGEEGKVTFAATLEAGGRVSEVRTFTEWNKTRGGYHFTIHFDGAGLKPSDPSSNASIILKSSVSGKFKDLATKRND
jgi:hypothetical protein